MIQKHYQTLLAVLELQKAECARAADHAWKKDDMKAHAFQMGAYEALNRALDYVKDAQAGILRGRAN